MPVSSRPGGQRRSRPSVRRATIASAMAGAILAFGPGLGATASTAARAAPTPTPPFSQCPAAGAETGCQILIVINPDGTRSITPDAAQVPYEGSNAALIGVQNNSGKTLTAITINADSQWGGGFSFTNAGPCHYVPTPEECATAGFGGPTGYSGPDNTFSAINAERTRGVVNFTGGLHNGESTWFALAQSVYAMAVSMDSDPMEAAVLAEWIGANPSFTG
jgi:hypothetical protein